MLWLFTAPNQAYAQQEKAGTRQSRTVDVAYQVSMVTRSQEEAKQIALRRAQAEAVRVVVGTQVQAERRSSTVETGDQLVSQFSQVVRTGASGRVTDYQILSEKVEQVGGQALYGLHLRATVTPSTGQPDPNFTADLLLNDEDATYVDRPGPLETNDEIIVTLRVTQDAYVTLFSITPDTIEVIWPNAYMTDTCVPANTPVEFPSPDWRQRGLRLRAEVPEGREEVSERIFLVATKKRIPFAPVPSVQIDQGSLRTIQTSLQALNRWLVAIPLDARVSSGVTYDIKRTK